MNGVRHRASDYPNKRAPWVLDQVKTVMPSYPNTEIFARHEGIGFFQLKLDSKTGSVSKVTILKSTGFDLLDERAISALRRWRWRPGKWREIIIPVKFNLPPLPSPRRTNEGYF